MENVENKDQNLNANDVVVDINPDETTETVGAEADPDLVTIAGLKIDATRAGVCGIIGTKTNNQVSEF